MMMRDISKEFGLNYLIRPKPERLYSLAEAASLANEFLDSEAVDRFRRDKTDLTPELLISNLIAWLAKREREGRG